MLLYSRQNSTESNIHEHSSTLKLPTTDFPTRSDQELIKTTILPQITHQLYAWNTDSRKPEKLQDVFLLHDGPPYSNGSLHVGHAFNKTLKDIINRFQLLQGKIVHYRPGWDCHGLPIELKAISNWTDQHKALCKLKHSELKKLKQTMKHPNSDPFKNLARFDLLAEKEKEYEKLLEVKLNVRELRSLARSHAISTQREQSDSFQAIGIMGDFENPYITLSPDYINSQLKVFQKLFQNGLVHRQDKPVYWGCENHTALAEGELEYNEYHASKAAYLKFPIFVPPAGFDFAPSVSSLYALIWTSTPWTIPANKAICVNENLTYTILHSKQEGNLIVARDLVSNVMQLNPMLSDTGIDISGEQLVGLQYHNPLLDEKQAVFPILHGSHVTNAAGTGLVHTAPGHGHDDYLTCLKHGIKAYSPVDEYGRYTSDLPEGCEDLVGLGVLKKGNEAVLEKMSAKGIVFHINDRYLHSYPYDWRSKRPIIVRSTPQWFINVDKIKDSSYKIVKELVDFFPARGRNRLSSFIAKRTEWCISRQRCWGVPIPAVYHKATGAPVINDELIRHIISVFEKEGTDGWFDPSVPITKWLPASLIGDAELYTKGTDTMDVWFDSGTSWTSVEKQLSDWGLLEEAKSRRYLADVYLEGSDQHRGWFQSSLLAKVGSGVLNEPAVAPYKTIITHGFTLDEQSKKMSKSEGNSLTIENITRGFKKRQIPPMGIDGLRLWVASSDYSNDVAVGGVILTRVAENLKKLRFTFRFLLGNLPTSPRFEKVSYSELRPLDQLALSKLYSLETSAKECFETYNFSKLIREVNNNMSSFLSSIYFDINKDVLYADDEFSHSRRCIQTVFCHIFTVYTQIMGPIAPALAQEAWNYAPKYITKDLFSPFLSRWQNSPEEWNASSLEDEFEVVWKVRDKFKSLVDQASRVEKTVGNSLETEVNVHVDTNSIQGKIILAHQHYMADYLLTSNFSVNGKIESFDYCYKDSVLIDGEEIALEVIPSKHHKCPRCWKYTAEKENELCTRCDEVVD